MPARRFKTIYLHVGLHKTGSTTIQHAMHVGRDTLARELGMLYPAFMRNHSTPLVAMFHHAPETYRRNVMEGIDTPASAAKHAESCRQSFEREMISHSGDVLFLSGEDVSDLKPEGVERLREWLLEWTDDPQIVCMVRDPVKWAVSAAQSSIRGGRTWEEVNSELLLLNASRRLGKFLAAFGADNMSVFSLEESRDHPGGLAVFLLERLGLPAVELPGDDQVNRNVAMSLEAAHIVSELNRRHPLFVDGKLNPARFLNDVVPIIRGVPGSPFVLEEGAMKRIRASANEDCRWLQENFGLELQVVDAAANERPGFESGVPFSREALGSVAAKLHELSQHQHNPKQPEKSGLGRKLRGKPVD